jgi:hypothetical protein
LFFLDRGWFFAEIFIAAVWAKWAESGNIFPKMLKVGGHQNMHVTQPVAGGSISDMHDDYPRTELELEQRFYDEAACLEYLHGLRWPEAFCCPGCGHQGAWAMKRGLWLCQHCRHQTSVLARTVFQDTKLPLATWFAAMWQLTSQPHGVSAMELQRVLKLGSYRTAWSILHKLRRTMGRPGRIG